ncbi:hypothetical protein FB451DRAFT_1553728 [Mycena latifolia]|nr:hypothetical protein FB451DRAFT_1553728 [Mycena latifolia]
MKLFARLFGATGVCSLAVLAPIFLSLLPASAAAAVLTSRNINPSLVPAACNTTCQPAISAQSTCGDDLKCLCTNTNGNSFAQCIDCVAGTVAGDTLAQSAAEGVLSEYTRKCTQNNTPISSLSLSLSGTSATPTGTVAESNDAPPLNAPRPLIFGFAALVLLAATL